MKELAIIVRKMTLPVIAGALLAGTASPLFGVIIADSQADFSGTQGLNNWLYGKYLPAGSANTPVPGTFTQLPTFNGGLNRWEDPSGSFSTPVISTAFMHPQDNGNWAVRRYTAEAGGLVNITGMLQHSQTGTSDGIVGRIYVNNRRVYAQLIPGNDTTIRNFSFNIQVNAGDIIDFAVDDRANFGSDGTQFSATIDTLPRTIIADSFADFAGTQNTADQAGSGTWQYGHYATVANPATFTTTGWTFGTQWTGPAGTNILTQTNEGGHPDGNSGALEPVRRWTAGVAGDFQIDGLLRKNNEDPNAGTNGSEGITAFLRLNGVVIQTLALGGLDNNSQYFSLLQTFAIGDTLDMVVSRDGPGAGNSFNFDGFDFGVVISAAAAIPEPATLALLGLSTITLLRRRPRSQA